MATILDSTSEAGVYGTRLLVEAGHRVIRVEAGPGGEGGLASPTIADEDYRGFMNAGKSTFVAPPIGGRSAIEALVAQADAVVATTPMDMPLEELQRINPGLVVTVIHQDEPEICIAARSGLMTLTGQPDGPPLLLGGYVFTSVIGIFAAVGTLAALHQRSVDGGRGQVVSISMRDCLESLGEQAVIEFAAFGRIADRIGFRGAVTAVSGAVRCSDGYVMLSVPATATAWRTFVEWVGDPVLVGDPSLEAESERRARQDEILGRVEAWALGKTSDELIQGAQDRHLPASPVARADSLVNDDQLRARGFLVGGLEGDPEGPVVIRGALATVFDMWSPAA